MFDVFTQICSPESHLMFYEFDAPMPILSRTDECDGATKNRKRPAS